MQVYGLSNHNRILDRRIGTVKEVKYIWDCEVKLTGNDIAGKFTWVCMVSIRLSDWGLCEFISSMRKSLMIVSRLHVTKIKAMKPNICITINPMTYFPYWKWNECQIFQRKNVSRVQKAIHQADDISFSNVYPKT